MRFFHASLSRCRGPQILLLNIVNGWKRLILPANIPSVIRTPVIDEYQFDMLVGLGQNRLNTCFHVCCRIIDGDDDAD